MRAVIRRDGKLVVDQMAAPTPAPGQLLAKSLVCGICGSDLHMLDHYDHMIDLTERLGGISQMRKGADTVFGHEFCCEVLESSGGFKAGDVVVSLPVLLSASGGDSIGLSSNTPGAFAETLVLSEMLTLKVPNGLAPEHAALTEPLAVGVHAVEKGMLKGDEAPLVVGCGPVGLAVIAALRLKNIRPIVAADFSPKRRELAVKMGADIVVDPAQEDP